MIEGLDFAIISRVSRPFIFLERSVSNTLFLTLYDWLKCMWVTPLWEWALLNRIWDSHDLMGPICISTNHKESVGKSVLQSVLLALLFMLIVRKVLLGLVNI